MKMRIVDPLSLVIILWFSIHTGYIAKAGVGKVVTSMQARHRVGGSGLGGKKVKPVSPPKWGKRSTERFYKEHEFVDGAWRVREVKP